jgi:hypothetical protein
MLDFYYITNVAHDGRRIWWGPGWCLNSFRPYFTLSDAKRALYAGIDRSLPLVKPGFPQPNIFADRAKKFLTAQVVETHSEGGLSDGTTCVIYKPISHEEQKAFTDSIEARLVKWGYTREWIQAHLELRMLEGL